MKAVLSWTDNDKEGGIVILCREVVLNLKDPQLEILPNVTTKAS